MARDRRYTIGELAELTGISRRSVHYYVQRGLVPPSLGRGRGHYYTDDHLERIRAVKKLQSMGLSLEEIERRFRAPQPEIVVMPHAVDVDYFLAETESPEPEREDEEAPRLLTRVKIAEGVELTVESGLYRLSPARLGKLRKAVREILGPGFWEDEEGKKGEKQ